MSLTKFAMLAGIAMAAFGAGQAQAFTVGPLTVTTSASSLPPVSGTLFSVDLSGFSPVTSTGTYLLSSGETLDLTGISGGDAGQAGVVQGSVGGKYAAPVTDSVGTKYAGNYLSSGIGSLTIDFPSAESVFALLWGSVDTYNTISFQTAGGPVSFTGSLMPNNNGNQGFGGSFYTVIESSVPFTAVTLSSTQYAFESATFEYGTSLTPTPAPEPAGMAVLGAGMLGLGFVRRRKIA